MTRNQQKETLCGIYQVGEVSDEALDGEIANLRRREANKQLTDLDEQLMDALGLQPQENERGEESGNNPAS